jgi:glycosyltransferase involved in cell wall biosynthesis
MSKSSEKGGGNMSPMICAIIPCHNHAAYVEQAIDSVVKQDYPNKMIAVANDGSTDDSKEKILGKFSHIQETKENVTVGAIANLPAIFLDNETPVKQSKVRNHLISLAINSCDVFCMLDADDYLHEEKFTACSKFITGDIGIVYNDVTILNERTGNKLYECREPYSRQRLEQENIITNCSLVNKQALMHVGGYDEEIMPCEDWDLWLRITEHFLAVHVPRSLHTYRSTGNNTTQTIPYEEWQRNLQLVHQKRLQRQNA